MKEIDEYKDEIHCLYAEKKELQERIDKAIEYCYECSYSLVTEEDDNIGRFENDDFDIEELLDILKGSDSNDNNSNNN